MEIAGIGIPAWSYFLSKPGTMLILDGEIQSTFLLNKACAHESRGAPVDRNFVITASVKTISWQDVYEIDLGWRFSCSSIGVTVFTIEAGEVNITGTFCSTACEHALYDIRAQ